MTKQEQKPYANTRQDAPFRFLGIPTVVRSTLENTNGAFGLMEHWMMPPGFGTPYHVHHNEDEAFYILEGEVAFVCDGQWLKAGPGTYVFGPREIPHGFKVVGRNPAAMLLLCTPGGFERFVLELATDMTTPPAPPDIEKLVSTAAKYGIDILGPLPEQTDATTDEGEGYREMTDNVV
jgi:quercetin dioxygenase-like cupin family protein